LVLDLIFLSFIFFSIFSFLPGFFLAILCLSFETRTPSQICDGVDSRSA